MDPMTLALIYSVLKLASAAGALCLAGVLLLDQSRGRIARFFFEPKVRIRIRLWDAPPQNVVPPEVFEESKRRQQLNAVSARISVPVLWQGGMR